MPPLSNLPHQLTSPYYLVHYIVLGWFYGVYYPRLRMEALSTEIGRERLLSVGKFTHCRHEVEVVMILLLFFLYKSFSYYTFDSLFHQFLLFGKILSLLLVFLTGNRGALLILLEVYLALLVGLPAPPNSRTRSNDVLELSTCDQFDDQFDDIILSNTATAADTSHLLLCYTPSNEACHFFMPIFHQMSSQYHNPPHLTFCQVNLQELPNLATDLSIDITTRSKQLPSLLLYYQGQLVRRLPPFVDDGNAVRTRMDKVRMVFIVDVCCQFSVFAHVLSGAKLLFMMIERGHQVL
jgi:hypothetical protein